MSPLAIAQATIPTPVWVLLVQNAGGGSIVGVDDHHLRLTLNKVSDYVTSITLVPLNR